MRSSHFDPERNKTSKHEVSKLGHESVWMPDAFGFHWL